MITFLASAFSLAVLGGFVGVRFVQTARWMLEAEDRLHLAISTGQMIDSFIQESDPPRWPSSWDELLDAPSSQELMEWDREVYKAEVIVDFNTDLDSVAAQTRDTLAAIALRERTIVENWQDYLPNIPQAARDAIARGVGQGSPTQASPGP